MGLSNEMNPTPDEESLPLYSNLEYDDASSSTPLALPEATATPDVVREFLVQILVNNRSLPLDRARRIAARWNMGSGRELWIYSPAMYNTIFGPEDGWVLYKDVKVMHYNTEQAKKSPFRRHVAALVSAILLILNFSLITWAATCDLSEVQIAAVAVVVFFGGLGMILSFVIACVEGSRNIENDIEAELRRSFFSNSGSVIPQHGMHAS